MASTRNLDQLNAIANACSANCDGLDTNGEILDNLAMLAEAGQLSGDGVIVVDSALDETSVAPVQNRVIARLIPAEANSGNRLTDKAYVDVGLAGKADADHTHDNSALEAAIDSKVDKEDGKVLSSNDFTDEDKERLASLHNYDDSELQSLVANKVDKIEGKGLSTNDFTDEDKAKLDSLENNNDIDSPENDYKHYVDSLPYAQIGKSAGVAEGYLRQYKKPKKICIIGNSITAHAPYAEGDGIEGNAPDYREMNASTPNSGWVGLLYSYITKHINPECKVYKANGSSWEAQGNGAGLEGSREYSMMANEQAYEVTSTGSRFVEGFTIDDMLTEDTDIVIFQLSENMTIMNGSDLSYFTNDFEKLYASVRTKCPKAEMYEFFSFWVVPIRNHAMACACAKYKVNPIFAPNFVTAIEDQTRYQAQSGDTLYDINGNPIGTTPQAVAGHPNDNGFRIMATYTLDALFNNRSVYSKDFRHYYTLSDSVENPTLGDINVYKGDVTSLSAFENAYGTAFESFVLNGTYSVAMAFPPLGEASHSTVIIESPQSFSLGYCPVTQRCVPANTANNEVKEVYRNVALNGNTTVYNPFHADKYSTFLEEKFERLITYKDYTYTGAISAGNRITIASKEEVWLAGNTLISMNKIRSDTSTGCDNGTAFLDSDGNLVYLPTTSSDATYIQIRVAACNY